MYKISLMVRKINVLLIEDDFEIGKWLGKRILELSNIESLSWETSIEKALINLSLNNPDIIILDLKLPDGNGIDLLKKIKKAKKESKVFIFSVSNELRKTCLRSGADCFFDKTTDSEILIKSLK
ncbi:response regulator [Confluentibacter lentus]|uniref:response regulator n=1 Tax=Confluentibacter lentus TaxID=1699412 RepID=UPI000C28351C|nr:response regulator [Confluentibacter lentus]